MKTDALIFLNGTAPSGGLIKSLGDISGNYTVATDGAYGYAVKYAKIDLLLGDFDSLDLSAYSVPKETEILRYAVRKNFTDGYLAVKECAARGIKSVCILGAFGGRPDHEYCNYSLLALCRELNMKAVIKGEDFDVYFVDERIKFAAEKGKTVSVVPFSDKAHILYTKGLEYPSDGYTYDKIDNLSCDELIMGVSNCAVGGEAEVALASGKILLFVER